MQVFRHDRSAGHSAWPRVLGALAIIAGAIALFVDEAHAAAVATVDPLTAQSWLDYVKALWPVVLCVAGLLIAGALLGLATRFATVVDLKALRKRVDEAEGTIREHAGRIDRLEEHCEASPTRVELQEDIAELSERMRGVEVGLEGLQATGKTTNTYLQMLIDRGLAK